MLNFASLFNQWRTQNNNGVLDILSQPNITMGRLLDQDSFQGEYKSGSPKIIEFMTYERFEELIDFVTVVGPADDKKRSYKYPLAACQVLSIENSTALDYFLPEKQIVLENKIEEQVEVETEVEVEDDSPEEKEEQNKPSDSTEGETEPAKGETKQQNAAPIADKPEQKAEQKQIVEQEKGDEVEILQETPAEEEKKPEETTEGEQAEKPEQKLELETPKKTKKIMKKELKTVERVETKEVPALIYKLLAYFDGEINYTLAGYVSKILAAFLNRKPNQVPCKIMQLLKYVLESNTMHKIINHAESRSVGEFIVKALTHESTIMLEERKQFFRELLNRCSVTSGIEIISNLSAYICEIIEKVATNLKGNNKIAQFNETFFSLDIITQVIKNVISDEENVGVYNAPILLTYLTNVPFVLPEDEAVVNQFIKLGQSFINKSVEKLQVDKRSRPKLGYGRLKIIEIIRFILRDNVLQAKDIVAKTDNFFPTILNLMKTYEMNNVLHNEIIRILETALTQSEESELNKAVLKDNILLNFIKEEWQEDKKIKAGDSVYKYRKGYIAHVINLCIKLRELGESNASIRALTENEIFTSIFESSVEKEIFNTKKSLAGLMKKQLKHEILFQKEDIIAAHMTFLQKCPSPVFDPEPVPTDHINIEAPDLVQELQRQLEENMNIKGSSDEQKSSSSESSESSSSSSPPATVIPPKVAKSETQAEMQQNEGRFWATHLEYNIDDLMADL